MNNHPIYRLSNRCHALDVRKVIVIGGSAGGIQSLCRVLKDLPVELDAPVLGVIHTSQRSVSLAQVLARCSQLEVVTPQNVMPLTGGRVYIAAANRHLVVRSHCVISWMGPRENRHRPSVDALFRTAARAYRSAVVAVILSGALDDGAAGALAVKARGGTVIVQDPQDAAVPDMPANVMQRVQTDHCLKAAEIPRLLSQLAAQGRQIKFRKPTLKQCEPLANDAHGEMEPPALTCPECGGVVVKMEEGKSARLRCHVGHTFSLDSFSEAHADALERALWIALRRLNEHHNIQENLATSGISSPGLRKRHQENADAAKKDMQLLHEILARL